MQKEDAWILRPKSRRKREKKGNALSLRKRWVQQKAPPAKGLSMKPQQPEH